MDESDAPADEVPGEPEPWVTLDAIQRAIGRAGGYMLGGMSHLGALGLAADEMSRDSG